MKGSRRRFKADGLQHIYQKTFNYGVIFYRIEDYLLFFTLFCTIAKRLKVKVVSLCLMLNHIHSLVECNEKRQLSKFVQMYTSQFVREFNRNNGRKGSLFCANFGSAPKVGKKNIMSTISYIGNNPVLKDKSKNALEYRWTFLSYYNNKNPFSKRLVIRDASAALKDAVKMVDYFCKHNAYLSYRALEMLFKDLNKEEKEQLVDYIITSYSVIDYEASISYYGSYDKMLLAIDSNSGSEYDMKEDWDSESDAVFDDMIEIVNRLGFGGLHGFNFQNLKVEVMLIMVRAFRKKVHISKWHLRKFFHLDLKTASMLMHYS